MRLQLRKDDSQSISVLQYADPKSDLDITQQNVTILFG